MGSTSVTTRTHCLLVSTATSQTELSQTGTSVSTITKTAVPVIIDDQLSQFSVDDIRRIIRMELRGSKIQNEPEIRNFQTSAKPAFTAPDTRMSSGSLVNADRQNLMDLALVEDSEKRKVAQLVINLTD